MYAKSKSNPADDTSCGLSHSNVNKLKRRINGPEFLWENEETWTKSIRKNVPELDNEDPKFKSKVPVHVIKAEDDDML